MFCCGRESRGRRGASSQGRGRRPLTQSHGRHAEREENEAPPPKAPGYRRAAYLHQESEPLLQDFRDVFLQKVLLDDGDERPPGP